MLAEIRTYLVQLQADGSPLKLNNVILGLAKGKDLKHWVYKKDDGCAFNWGKKESLAEVLSECSRFRDGIGYQIAGLGT